MGFHIFSHRQCFFFIVVVNFGSDRKGISKGVLATAVVVAVVCAIAISSILTVVIKKRHERYKHTSSRKALRKFPIKTLIPLLKLLI